MLLRQENIRIMLAVLLLEKGQKLCSIPQIMPKIMLAQSERAYQPHVIWFVEDLFFFHSGERTRLDSESVDSCGRKPYPDLSAKSEISGYSWTGPQSHTVSFLEPSLPLSSGTETGSGSFGWTSVTRSLGTRLSRITTLTEKDISISCSRIHMATCT